MTNCGQTKNGKRMNDRPRARSWMMVTMRSTEPSSEEVMRKTMPINYPVIDGKDVGAPNTELSSMRLGRVMNGGEGFAGHVRLSP